MKKRVMALLLLSKSNSNFKSNIANTPIDYDADYVVGSFSATYNF